MSARDLGARPRPAASRARIDPRIRQRRIDVARAVGRRRLRILLWAVGGALVLAGAWAVLHSPLTAARHLRVQGAVRTTHGDLERAAGIPSHPELVGYDLGAARKRIEALPWVLDASVERVWPQTIRVRVTERVPAAAVAVDAAAHAADCPDSPCFAWVDSTGRVLAIRSGAHPGPVLAGVAGPAAAGDALPADAAGPLAVVAALRPPLADVVREVGVAHGGQETILRLSSGGVVRLGDSSRLADKLAAAATVVAQHGMAGYPVLDVRAPSNPVLSPDKVDP